MMKFTRWLARRVARTLTGIAALGCVALAANGHAAGLMTPVNGAQALTLDQHHVEVTVENGYTMTSIDQTFANPHTRDLDARYSFPVPESAAVGEFTYWIDGNPVHAEVLRKREARELHEAQKQQGNETALVEKDAYRTFDVMVSPVRAGQDVRVRLVYLQRAAIDHSIGRYVYQLEEGGVDVQRDSFWSGNDTVASAFSFKLRLRSAYPVDAVRVPSGRGTVTQRGPGEWNVVIDSSQGSGMTSGDGLSNQDIIDSAIEGEGTSPMLADSVGGGRPTDRTLPTAGHGVARLDKDIVVYWRLADDLPGAVDLVTYREPGAVSGTFMLTMTPGIDLAPITEGRDWVFVLDTSGSMAGKFTALTEGVRQALGTLSQADRHRVILFSDEARELTNGFRPASEVAKTLAKLDRLKAGGATNLFDGLSKAMRSLDSDRTTAVVLITDGVVTVGERQMSRFLKLVEPLDVRLFTAVMGNSANRPLLDGLTEHSKGFAVSVSNDDDIVGLMTQVASKVTHESLHDVSIKVDGVRASALTREQHARVYRGEQLVVLGRYTGSGKGKVTLNASVSGEQRQYVSSLVFPESSTDHPELERLWAFATIENLEAAQRLIGETEDRRDAITDVALAHGLVTDHTSMIVVGDEVFQAQGIERRNATRVERERAARATRAAQPVKSTRQDAAAPTFPTQRQSVSSGGGSLGGWMLLVIAAIASLRLAVTVFEKVMSRRRDDDHLQDTGTPGRRALAPQAEGPLVVGLPESGAPTKGDASDLD